MFDKVKALCGLILMGSQQNEEINTKSTPVVFQRQIINLKAELTLYKEIAKSRYEQNEPMKAKIKALEVQNEYLRGTNNLMRETIEAQTEALKSQSEAKTVTIPTPFGPQEILIPNSSSFDSKNS